MGYWGGVMSCAPLSAPEADGVVVVVFGRRVQTTRRGPWPARNSISPLATIIDPGLSFRTLALLTTRSESLRKS